MQITILSMVVNILRQLNTTGGEYYFSHCVIEKKSAFEHIKDAATAAATEKAVQVALAATGLKSQICYAQRGESLTALVADLRKEADDAERTARWQLEISHETPAKKFFARANELRSIASRIEAAALPCKNGIKNADRFASEVEALTYWDTNLEPRIGDLEKPYHIDGGDYHSIVDWLIDLRETAQTK